MGYIFWIENRFDWMILPYFCDSILLQNIGDVYNIKHTHTYTYTHTHTHIHTHTHTYVEKFGMSSIVTFAN